MPKMPSRTETGKLDWIEPTVLVLEVEETFGVSNNGADGDIHADCTRS